MLEPIFEADFEDGAYGYRPRRGAGDAIKEVHRLWLLAGDSGDLREALANGLRETHLPPRIGNNLAVVLGLQNAPVELVDRVLDKVNAAIGKEGVHTAGVIAAGVQRHVGWPAVVLIDRVPVHLHVLAGVRETGGPADAG